MGSPTSTVQRGGRGAPADPEPIPPHGRHGRTLLPWLPFLAYGLGVTCAAAFLGAMRYSVNDDGWLQAVVSGAAGGEPEGRTGVTWWLFTGPIALMYRLLPGVAWYPVVLLACWVVALAVIAGVLWRRLPALWALAALGATAFFAVGSIVRPSFTSAAVAVTAAGWVLALHGAERAHGSPRRLADVACGVLLVWVGAVVRWESFLTVTVIFAPSAVFVLWRLDTWRQRIALVAAGVALVGLHTVDGRAQVSGDWREFPEFNTPRSLLHSTPRLWAPGNEAALAAAGWTYNDKVLFDSWIYRDPEVFTTESVRILDQMLPVAPGVTQWPRLLRAEGVDALSLWWNGPPGGAGSSQVLGLPLAVAFVLFFAALLSAVVNAGRRRWRLAAFSAAGAATFPMALSVSALLIVFYRLTPPMVVPSVMAVAVACMVAASPLFERRPRTAAARAVTAVVACALVAASLWGAAEKFSASRAVNLQLADTAQAQLRGMAALPTGSRVVLVGGAFTYEGLDPWRGWGELLPSSPALSGWPTFSPPGEGMMRRAGFGANLFDGLLQEGTYVLISAEAVPAVEQYYREHRSLQVAATPVGGGLYRFAPTSGAAEDRAGADPA